MNFFEKYADLQKQKRQIRREMRQKREAITCNAWVDNLEDKKCVKTMSVFGLGVGGFLGASEYERCENFDDEKPCTDYNCILCNKNHAYTNKVDLYNTIKAAQWNLIKEALHLQKQ
jgi:hypothetical protein